MPCQVLTFLEARNGRTRPQKDRLVLHFRWPTLGRFWVDIQNVIISASFPARRHVPAYVRLTPSSYTHNQGIASACETRLRLLRVINMGHGHVHTLGLDFLSDLPEPEGI
jgi:hypothetical protein